MKNNFLRSYLKLALGGAGLSLIIALFATLDEAFSLGYLKLIAEVIIFIALIVYYKKNNKIRNVPRSSNGLLLVLLVPVLINFWCFYSPLNNKVAVGSLLLATLDLIFGVLLKQILFIAIGVMLFKKDKSYKLVPKEMLAIVSAFLISSCFDGFNIELVGVLSIAFISLALYLKTSSLDLSISFALLMQVSTQIFSYFSISDIAMNHTYFIVIYLSNTLLISLIAYGVLRNNNLLSTAEYN